MTVAAAGEGSEVEVDAGAPLDAIVDDSPVCADADCEAVDERSGVSAVAGAATSLTAGVAAVVAVAVEGFTGVPGPGASSFAAASSTFSTDETGAALPAG